MPAADSPFTPAGSLLTTSPRTPAGLRSRSRYRVLTAIASGGMATVYVGSLRGPGGFERRVAIKRAHPQLLTQPATRRLLVQEARLAARIHHPNVVSMRDVEDRSGELLLVMDYVEGASLARLMVKGPIALRVVGRILADAALGLAAVHDLAGAGDERLAIVHRDISPSNILVGLDGTARIADFGIAKNALAGERTPNTTMGAVRGKPAYMAPEYLVTGVATPRIDVFALGVVAWEALTGRRLFRGLSESDTSERVLSSPIVPPSTYAPEVPPALDAVIGRALERNPHLRPTAGDFCVELEAALQRAALLGTRQEVAELVEARGGEAIRERRQKVYAAALEPSGSSPQVRVRLDKGPRRSRASERAIAWSAALAGALVAVVVLAVRVAGMARAPSLDAMATQALTSIAPPPSPPASEPAPPAPPETRVADAPPPLELPATPASAPPRVTLTSAVTKGPPRARPSDCESLAAAADRRRAEHDFAGATTLYEEALARSPHYLPARIALADLAWESGQTERARRAYGALVDQGPTGLLPARVVERARGPSD